VIGERSGVGDRVRRFFLPLSFLCSFFRAVRW
jgi:hypothetical protein